MGMMIRMKFCNFGLSQGLIPWSGVRVFKLGLIIGFCQNSRFAWLDCDFS